jgi:hypothetical protein
VTPCPKKEIGCMRKKNEGGKKKGKKRKKNARVFLTLPSSYYFFSPSNF